MSRRRGRSARVVAGARNARWILMWVLVWAGVVLAAAGLWIRAAFGVVSVDQLQMNPQNVLLRFEEVAKAGGNIVDTDIPNSMLGPFVDLAGKAREFSPVSVELTPPEVDAEYPDYAVVQQLVQQGIAEASPPDEEETE